MTDLERLAAAVKTMRGHLAEVLRLSEPHEAAFEALLDAATEAAGEHGLDEADEERIAVETGWRRFALEVRDLADLATEVEARHNIAEARRGEAWIRAGHR